MEPEEILREAQIALNGSREERARAFQALEQLVQAHFGMTVASQAQALLVRERERSGPSWFREDAEAISALERAWAGIYELEDARLSSVVQELFELELGESPRLTQVRAVALDKLRCFLESDRRRLEAGVVPQYAPVLPEVLAMVQRHPAYRIALQAELQHWQMAFFQAQWQSAVQHIELALTAWNIETAWRVFKALPLPPEHLVDTVEALRERVTAVSTQARQVQTLLDSLSGTALRTWEELTRCLGVSAELQQMLRTSATLPAHMRERCEVALAWQIDATGAFLQTTAQACKNLEALRDFYTRVSACEPEVRALLKDDWYIPAQQAYDTSCRQALRQMSSIEDLGPLQQQLLAQRYDLPPAVVSWLEERAVQCQHLYDIWQQIRAGERFALPAGSEDTMPPALVREATVAQHLLAELDNLAQRCDALAPTAMSEIAWEESRQWLERFLAAHRGHAVAQQMQHELARRRLGQHCDQLLMRWEVRRFVDYCHAHSITAAEADYARLATSDVELQRLASLALAPVLPDVKTAALWWTGWYTCLGQLPALDETPAVFMRTVLHEEQDRMQQWLRLLDTLLGDPQVSPEACQEAAAMLQSYNQVPVVQYYVTALQHLSGTREVERALDHADWEKAAVALQRLEQAGASDEILHRLGLRLRIAQARYCPQDEVLWDIVTSSWRYILAYLPAEAPELLLEALEDAWQQQQESRLRALHTLAEGWCQAEASTEPLAQRLALWVDWLSVERALDHSIAPDAMQRLVRVLFPQGGESFAQALYPQVQRLIQHWQQQGEHLLLAWAYRAFVRVTPPFLSTGIDPLQALEKADCMVAAQVMERLRASTPPTLEALDDLAPQLTAMWKRWQQLQRYSDLLPFPTAAVQLPAAVQHVSTVVASLREVWGNLAILDEADLRQNEARALLTGVRLTLLQLAGEIPSVRPLIAHTERLGHLRGVGAMVERFGRTAQRCTQERELDTPHMFAGLAEIIKEMITLFQQARVEGLGMWQAVSRDCSATLTREAGVLAGLPESSDLQTLYSLTMALEDEEQRWKRDIIALERAMPRLPSGGTLRAEDSIYAGFFALFPAQAPRAIRHYMLFDQFARRDPMPIVLRDGVHRVPLWLQEHLKGQQQG